jgi:hypothetical protein
MATKKKLYEKPSMRVLELKQQLALLAGSVGNGIDPYTLETEEQIW